MARQTLAAKNMRWVVICEPVRPSAVWPFSLVTTRKLRVEISSLLHTAAMTAAHPRQLTGL